MTRHPLLLYFGYAFAGWWASIGVGIIFPRYNWVQVLGVFAPALGALSITKSIGGRQAAQRLLSRLCLWRVGVRWYAAVVGLPLAELLLAVLVAALFGKVRGFNTEVLNNPVLRFSITPPGVVLVFILAAGEELGWRGYALPQLLVGHSAVSASLILGAIHEVWHWPVILLPHQQLSSTPVLAHAVAIVSYAIVFTWVYQHTEGSVLMAVIYHAIFNFAGVLYRVIEIDPSWKVWVRPSASVLIALVVVAATGVSLTSKGSHRPMSRRMLS